MEDERIPRIPQLVDRFFADCQQENMSPNAAQLRAWLWFTCPAYLRSQVRPAIEDDPRFKEVIP
jgi:hypothetical protein